MYQQNQMLETPKIQVIAYSVAVRHKTYILPPSFKRVSGIFPLSLFSVTNLLTGKTNTNLIRVMVCSFRMKTATIKSNSRKLSSRNFIKLIVVQDKGDSKRR